MIRRHMEFWVFLTLAVALHLAFFLQMPSRGAQASGAGGEEFVTILAATEQVETMVAEWKRPPDVQTPEVRQALAPAPIQFEPPTAPVELVALPELHRPEDMAPPEPDDIVTVREPPPPPPPEPEPELEPEPEEATEQAPASGPMPKRRETPPKEKPKPEAPSKAAQPAQKAQTASTGHAGQKAAGTGSGTQAGDGNQSVSTGVSKEKAATLQQVWGAKIRSRIERAKRFPSGRRESARVGVSLTVGADGRLLGVSVYRSSGIPTYDAAAVQSVRRVGRFPKAPKGLANKSYNFSVTLTFNP
ncbi:energy transducer TonB [Tropicimonas marinistellae]|uniref:energy transducer TonB n=1 Tax=Tropicimonas marinistellae TaxID=1739787 RepID=UPI00082BD6ED|nr:TonB family protein [Tropicimonas marinistellae]